MKTTDITETIDLTGQPGEDNILESVKLLGEDSKNGRRYPKKVREAAKSLFEGAKCFTNHPKNPLEVRKYQERLGTFFAIENREDGLFGSFRYNPNHPVASQLVWEAENPKDAGGFSVNIAARLKQVNGETVCEEIVRVRSVDLVAEPATTANLFESEKTHNEPPDADRAKPDDAIKNLTDEVSDSQVYEELTVEMLQDIRPDIVEGITRQVTIDVAAAVKALMMSPLPFDAWDRNLVDQIVVTESEDELNALIKERMELYERLHQSSRRNKPHSRPKQTGSGIEGGKDFANALK